MSEQPTKPLPSSPVSQSGDWATVDELAAEMRVDRKTLYSAVKAGKVPGVLRLGPKRFVVSRTALVASLSRQPSDPRSGSGDE